MILAVPVRHGQLAPSRGAKIAQASENASASGVAAITMNPVGAGNSPRDRSLTMFSVAAARTLSNASDHPAGNPSSEPNESDRPDS